MTEEQELAFKLAEQKLIALMSALYNIRNHFYINNQIPDNGHGVWKYIPMAQSLLNNVEGYITEARESAFQHAAKETPVPDWRRNPEDHVFDGRHDEPNRCKCGVPRRQHTQETP